MGYGDELRRVYGAGYMVSYWLVVAMLAYLFFYAVSGSKNVNKDIPVEEEMDARNVA